MLRKLYHNLMPIGWFLAFITSFGWRKSLPEKLKAEKFTSKDSLLLVFPIIPTPENYEMVNEQFCALLREKYNKVGREIGVEITTLFITEGTNVQMTAEDWKVLPKMSKATTIEMAYAPDHIFNFHRDLKIQEDSLDLLRFLPEQIEAENILFLKSAQMNMKTENIWNLLKTIKSGGVICVDSCVRPEAIGFSKPELDKIRTVLPKVKPQFQPNETKTLLKRYLASASEFLTETVHEVVQLNSAVASISNERAQFNAFYKHEMPEYIQASNISYWMVSDQLPEQYKNNIPQKENMNFLFLPEKIPKTKCDETKSEFIYLVKTARNEVTERFTMRRIFKSDESSKKANYFFFLGADSNGDAFGSEKQLKKEAEKYQDIVIADFKDSYNNLPLKTQSMYDFATSYCSESILYFVFHDSDTIFDFQQIENQLKKKVRFENFDFQTKKTIKTLNLHDNLDVTLKQEVPFLYNSTFTNGHGVVHEPLTNEKARMIAIRTTGWNHGAKYDGKYNLTMADYPPLMRIPDYCNGQGAVLNRKALEKIHAVSKITEMGGFRIEDMYYTGILRLKAGIPSPERVLYYDLASEPVHRGKMMHHMMKTANHNSKEAVFGTAAVVQGQFSLLLFYKI